MTVSPTGLPRTTWLACILAACATSTQWEHDAASELGVAFDASSTADAGLRRADAQPLPFDDTPRECPDGITLEAREASQPIDLLVVMENCVLDRALVPPEINCFDSRIRNHMLPGFRELWRTMRERDLDVRVFEFGGGAFAPSREPGVIPDLSDYVQIDVHALDAWTRIFVGHDEFDQLLREDARTEVLILTHGQPVVLNAEEFVRTFETRFDRTFRLHAVVSPQLAPTATNPLGACSTASGTVAAAGGGEYIRAAEQTGGSVGDVCTGDWEEILDALSSETIERTPLPCSLAMPLHPLGHGFYVPSDLDVRATLASGATWALEQRTTCDDGDGLGWTWSSGSQRIDFCPAACAELERRDAQVHVRFGCE